MSTISLFRDFTSKVKDLFSYNKYDLGRTIEIKSFKDMTAKANLEKSTKPKFTLSSQTDFASIEISEDYQKELLSLEVSKLNFFGIVGEFTCRSDGSIEWEDVYQPNGSFWNTTIGASFCPSNGLRNRLCTATVSGAVGDDDLGLSVGGKLNIQSKGNSPTELATYSLGFLYEPNKNSSYSLKFCPQKNSSALEYSLTCYQKYGDNCEIAVCSEGRADTQIIGAETPTLTFAGGWNFENKRIQSFMNTDKEFGIIYKFSMSSNVDVQLGVANLKNPMNGNYDCKFGYQFSV